MNENEFLSRIGNLQIWKRHGLRAPHKPLMLLLALTRLANDSTALLKYEEVEPLLTKLLIDFGPIRPSHNPQEPFRRLVNDGIWQLRDSHSVVIDEPLRFSPTEMKKHGVQGGFNQETLDLLTEHPHLIRHAIRRILTLHFPESYFKPILEQLNFDDSLDEDFAPVQDTHQIERKKRDPRFREKVLREYGRQCAICESSIRLQDSLLDLEAAHIKWHTEGGPDTVANGLALCTFHHRAFDRGALGLSAIADRYKVIVSSELNGTGPGRDWLLNFHAKPILKPAHSSSNPDAEFVEWHRSEVFKGNPF